MTITIIDCEKKVTSKKIYCEGACDHRAVKRRQQEKEIIVKVLVIMSSFIDYVRLSLSQVE
jgi:hypothetical protein